MSLFSLIIIFALFGLVMWAINSYFPMADSIKKALNIIVVIVLLLFFLKLMGWLPDLNAVRVGN